jgi:phosphotriesterase-related protein
MNRRAFLKASSAAATTLAVFPWQAGAKSRDDRSRYFMTVRGPRSSERMGVALTHEHLVADTRFPEEKVRDPRPYDHDEVLEVVLPHLDRIRSLGCRTFMDLTGVHLGRDAAVLRRISKESGMQILCATGNYAALELRAVSGYLLTSSIDELAHRWIAEWEHGIEGSDVRPGLIKLGMDGGPLPHIEEKMIRAAAITHLETGLTICAHISGPNEFLQGQGIRSWAATSAREQLAILESAGVSPSAWIWEHAQNGAGEPSEHVNAARRGAWLSFDGVGGGGMHSDEMHLDMVMRLREEGLLHRVLVSQDSGWYHVGEPGGGMFRGYDTVFTEFIPALRERGVTESEIETIFVRNPADAFSIAVRRKRS